MLDDSIAAPAELRGLEVPTDPVGLDAAGLAALVARCLVAGSIIATAVWFVINFALDKLATVGM